MKEGKGHLSEPGFYGAVYFLHLLPELYLLLYDQAQISLLRMADTNRSIQPLHLDYSQSNSNE